MYLGVCLMSSKKFKCSVTDRIQKFYKCANAIFRIEGRSDNLTILSLVESHCLPILTTTVLKLLIFSTLDNDQK